MFFSIALVLANLCPQPSAGFININYNTDSDNKYVANNDSSDEEESVLVSREKNKDCEKETTDEELADERFQMLAFSISDEIDSLQNIALPIE